MGFVHRALRPSQLDLRRLLTKTGGKQESWSMLVLGTMCPRPHAGERLKKLGERLHGGRKSVFLNALDDRGFRSPSLLLHRL